MNATSLLLTASLATSAGAETPIKPLDAVVPEGTPSRVAGQPVDFQPEAFEEASLAKALSVRTEPLAPPFERKVYQYALTSYFTYVVEILRDGERHALFTHVEGGAGATSPDGRHLYLSNNLRDGEGRWWLLRRIVRVEDKRRIELPALPCTERGGFWDDDRLITFGLHTDGDEIARGHETPICAWSTEGELLAMAELDACWHAASDWYLGSSMGLLPAEPSVLWLYNGDCPSLREPGVACTVQLQELDGERRARTVPLPDASDGDLCREARRVVLQPGASTFETDAWTVRLED